MNAEELTYAAPPAGTMRDVRLRCEEDILGKPLAECDAKEVGRLGEDLAVAYLEKTGLEISDRNWRCRFGEVDIIARDGDTAVLVEVKARTAREDDAELAPELAVNYRKQGKYQKLALMYLAEHAECSAVRFDVIALKLFTNHDSILRHLSGAFEWDD